MTSDTESRSDAYQLYVLWYICLLGIALNLLTCSPPANCYPQYQAFVEKHSGRTVNCSLCHINDNGPVGTGRGQLGSLNTEQLGRLNEERAAIQPGKAVNSPILNKFGNQIIKTLGRGKFLQTISDPAQLAVLLGDKSDLDGDGIADSREYLDGTDPLNKFHGDAWRLFIINLDRYKIHILLSFLSLGLLCYGLTEMYRGSSLLSQAALKASSDREQQ
jgi:hypothetical protein